MLNKILQDNKINCSIFCFDSNQMIKIKFKKRFYQTISSPYVEMYDKQKKTQDKKLLLFFKKKTINKMKSIAHKNSKSVEISCSDNNNDDFKTLLMSWSEVGKRLSQREKNKTINEWEHNWKWKLNLL